jgi:hypothetical protein
MNERIREVWIKAAREDSDPDNWDTQEQFIERFAELIVRECVIQCEREWIRHGADSAHNQAIHGCINSIKQHFGVEE